MNEPPIQVGRVLRASTVTFTAGCRQLIADQGQMIPRFGALVKAVGGADDITYGLISNVTVEDDAFVRQIVAAGADKPEFIEDQRQNRQVPIVVDVLTVGHGAGTSISHRLPPQPPQTLDPILACNNAELHRFTEKHDWLRLVLASLDAPVDQLIVASLRAASAARPSPAERETYMVGAGRELARLLMLDLNRLDGMLRQLRD